MSKTYRKRKPIPEKEDANIKKLNLKKKKLRKVELELENAYDYGNTRRCIDTMAD